MLSARCLLCLTLLVSSVGSAQAPEDVSSDSSDIPAPPPSLPPLVPTPGPPAAEPLKGESIPYQYQPESQARGRTPRIVLETLGGFGAGGVSLLGGVLIALKIQEREEASPLPIMLITTGAIVLSVPLGVYLTGRLMGARGSYLASLLGMVLGSVVGVASAVIIARELDGDIRAALFVFTLTVWPLTGAVLGFELSHSSAQPTPAASPAAASARSSVQLAPVVGVTPMGGILGGLAGRF